MVQAICDRRLHFVLYNTIAINFLKTLQVPIFCNVSTFYRLHQITSTCVSESFSSQTKLIEFHPTIDLRKYQVK